MVSPLRTVVDPIQWKSLRRGGEHDYATPGRESQICSFSTNHRDRPCTYDAESQSYSNRPSVQPGLVQISNSAITSVCTELLPQFSVVLAIEAVPALSHGPVACLTRGVTVSSSGEEGIMLTTAMSFMP